MIEPSISVDHWQRIEALFYRALDVTPELRPSLLQDAAQVDATVAEEVTRLIALHEADRTFLEPPASPLAEPVDGAAHPGMSVGRFRLVEVIASGGMGTVWLAERADDQFTQRVAIKLMNVGPLSHERRRRFHLERQALARLEHPAITRLIDGGTTDDNVPYLVMEHVIGRPIDVHCDERHLSVRQRLELFRSVCAAVQYAHQNLIVNRDLKPGNILVTPAGQPKLVDFGVSKLIDLASAATDGGDGAAHTLVRALTPRYASPEQIRGEPVTTASDVYSLGVILYELLSGHRPYVLAGRASYEQERAICEGDPPAPSAVLSRADGVAPGGASEEHVALERLAEVRGTSPRQLRRQLTGDLDQIVLLAMRNEPRSRYASAEQMADDIGRHLDGLPVTASRPTIGYRFAKFARRNRTGVVAGFALAATLVGGLVASSVGWRQAREQRDVALRVTSFLQNVLAAANPYREGRDLGVFDLLDDAAARADTELAGQPEVEAAVRMSLAEAFGGLWRWDRASPQVRRALALSESLHGPLHPTVADAKVLLGRAMTWQREPAAVSVVEDALSDQIRLHGERHPAVARATIALAFARWTEERPRNCEATAALYRKGLAIYRASPESDPSDLAVGLFSFGSMLVEIGDLSEETEHVLAEARELFQAAPDRADRYAAEAMRTYALILQRRRQFDDEVRVLGEYLRRTPPMFTLDRRVIDARWRFAHAQYDRAFGTEAELGFRDALHAECQWRGTAGPVEGRDVFVGLAAGFAARGTLPDTAKRAVYMLDALDDSACGDSAALCVRMADFATVVALRGDFADAAALLEACLRLQQRAFPQLTDHRYLIQGTLGYVLTLARRLDEAKPPLIEAYRGMRASMGPRHDRLRQAVRRLAYFYDVVGERRKAEHYDGVLRDLRRQARSATTEVR